MIISRAVVLKIIVGTLSMVTSWNAMYAQTPRPLPANYGPGIKINYVRTWAATAPVSDANVLITKPLQDVKQTTQYLDGLGRPIQTVIKQGSLVTDPGNPQSATNAVDLVNSVVYDQFGRESYKYLPTPANNTGGNASISDGLFKNNPFQQQQAFYNNYLSTQVGEVNAGTNWAYGQTNFEASPLNRPAENFAPGSSWVGTEAQTNEANRRSVKIKHWINTATDEVRIWTVTDVAGALGTYVSGAVYPAGALYKTVMEDERGKQMIEFKDKQGQLVLKKMQNDAAAADNGSGTGHANWLCTYFLYDDFNNLRCVIQPEGVKLIAPSWVLTDVTVLAEQCFRYAYDQRKRMIINKIPGSGEVHMVYDMRDRLVFSQDANLRATNQWMTTLYDALNRPVLTGLTTYSGTRDALQTQVNTLTTTPSNPTTGLQIDITLKTPIGTSTHLAIRSIALEDGFETTTNAEFLAEIVAGPGGPEGETIIIEGMAVNKNPIPLGSTFTALTFTYYDDYKWTDGLPAGLKNFDIGYASSYLQAASGSSFPYPQAVQSSNSTTGLVTGSKVKVLTGSTTQYLTTMSFYDDKARLIQSRGENVTGGIDALTIQFTWAGQPLVTIQKHEKAGANAQTGIVVTQTTYDALNRVTKIEKKVGHNLVNGGAMPGIWTTLIQQEYDALGQVRKKKQGNKPLVSGTPLTNQEFEYNIRGWLTSINKSYITGSNNDQYFGMELGYDKSPSLGAFTPAYNGNISGTVWKNESDQQKRKYDFTYDAVNRLTAADFNQYVSGSGATAVFDKSAQVDYSVSNLTYDYNGNIKSQQQKGWKLTSSSLVDNLTYNYYPNTNKLKNVVDANNDVQTKLGDFRSSQAYMTSLGGSKTNTATDYTYDANGNLLKDLNKDIDHAMENGIKYSHLNLVEKINVKNKGTIEYTYDATGIKLKKTVMEGSTVTTTLYIGGFEYKNDELQQIAHEEGRIRFEKATQSTCPALPNRLVYDYLVKDHLGNTRMVLTEEQASNCYPGATVEDSRIATEQTYYSIVPARALLKSSLGIGQASFENKVYRVHGGLANEKTGLGMVLKVMAGDKVSLQAESIYTLPGGGAGTSLPVALTELLASFVGSGVVTNKGIMVGDITGLPGNTTLLNAFRDSHNPGSTTAKAALNWILLDEQFKYVTADFDPVQANGGYKQLLKFVNTPVNVTKSGYLYIYVSNESNLPVYFDNLLVSHTNGPILETNDYYPFGLMMAGINAKSMGKMDNKYEFGGKEKQEKEFSDGSGLELIDFTARTYDQQIGCFRQSDPHSYNYYAWSPYNYCANNPLMITDPTGKDWFQDKDGNIIWNNSRGKTYTADKIKYTNIGSTISITTISIIRNPNDIPVSFDVSGNKLQNIYTIEGKYDEDGNFTGFTSTFTRTTGKTEVVPGLSSPGAEDVPGKENSVHPIRKVFDIWVGGFEQHTEVHPMEKIALEFFGSAVDVNIDATIKVDGKGKLSVNFTHGTFPSVVMFAGTPSDPAKTRIYDYQQASYIYTHVSNPLFFNSQKGAQLTTFQQWHNQTYQPKINKGWVHFMGFNAGN